MQHSGQGVMIIYETLKRENVRIDSRTSENLGNHSSTGVEILPGKEGLLHISKISKERVNKVEDVLNVGDEILVKVIELNKEEGKFSLSAKDAMKV